MRTYPRHRNGGSKLSIRVWTMATLMPENALEYGLVTAAGQSLYREAVRAK